MSWGATIDRNAVQDIFNESDLIRDNSLNFNEFAVSLAICYLLDIIPNLSKSIVSADENFDNSQNELEPNEVRKISKAFDTVVNAYLMFDEDASGIIKWGEMKEVQT